MDKRTGAPADSQVRTGGSASSSGQAVTAPQSISSGSPAAVVRHRPGVCFFGERGEHLGGLREWEKEKTEGEGAMGED